MVKPGLSNHGFINQAGCLNNVKISKLFGSLLCFILNFTKRDVALLVEQ